MLARFPGRNRQALMPRLVPWLVVGILCATNAPSFAADFPTVVASILNAQTDGPLAKMDAAKKGRMIACVNKALAPMPAGMKRSVTAGTTLDEQEHLFGKAVMANRAEWKQKIANACAKLAVSGGV